MSSTIKKGTGQSAQKPSGRTKHFNNSDANVFGKTATGKLRSVSESPGAFIRRTAQGTRPKDQIKAGSERVSQPAADVRKSNHAMLSMPEIKEAITSIQWPPGSGSFTLYDESGRGRGGIPGRASSCIPI